MQLLQILKRLYQVIFAVPLSMLCFISVMVFFIVYAIIEVLKYIISGNWNLNDTTWAKWCNIPVNIFNKLMFIKEN